MRIADLSESDILARVLPVLAEHNKEVNRLTTEPRLLLGPGDDCAVLDLTEGTTVMSTDTLTEGHDFRQHWGNGETSSGFEVGWKAAAQNLADIAAMGASACTLLVSLSLPPQLPVDWVKDCARGMVSCCQTRGAENCSIAGGDLGRAEQISVTVTAVGVTSGRPVLRSGAQPGDCLAYAGVLGHAACGLQLLDSAAVTPENLMPWVRAQKLPHGALHAGLKAGPRAHAMIDISDGLVRDTRRIAEASGVQIDLDLQRLEHSSRQLIPAARYLVDGGYAGTATDAGELALDWVLTGGEDHAMLAAFAPGEEPEGFEVIGYCSGGDTPAVTLNGAQPPKAGWDHFGAR